MTHFLRVFMTLAVSLFSVSASAEDIDIYSGNTQGSSNLLIIIDNSSNWSATLAGTTKFAAEVNALSGILRYLKTPQTINGETVVPGENINIGLMLFNETGDSGGYVRFGMRPMNATNATALEELLNGLVSNGTGTDNAGSSQPYGKAMYEAMLYFRQRDARFGAHPTGSWRRDYAETPATGRGATQTRSARDYGLNSGFAFAPGTNRYSLPGDNACAKNYILFISNGNPGTGGDSGNPTSAELLNAAVQEAYPNDAAKRTEFSASTTVTSNGATIHASTADEWTRFLNATYGYIVYTTAVYQPQNNGNILNTDQQMINLMSSMGTVGGGKYFASTSPEELAVNLSKVINDVRAVDSVFVSASLPVSVNTQGTYLNQVYMGLFRPDAGPRWMGNLKRYKFYYNSVTDSISLVGATNTTESVVNPGTGFISPDAQSFWSRTSITTQMPQGYWARNPSGLTTTGNRKDDIPDGEVVEKGGVAEQIRLSHLTSQSNRKIYTCPLSGCSSNTNLTDASAKFDLSGANGGIFSSNNDAHLALFGITDTGQTGRSAFMNLIPWIRGNDNKGDEKGPGDTATVTVTIRPSVHGDVLHSRPVAVNYASNRVVVFYGSNDGMFRAVDAGKADETESTAALQNKGQELWGFVAPEHYKLFNRLRDNEPVVKLPTTPSLIEPAPKPKEYFFDGSPGVYQEGSKVWLFVPARRGGRFIYALDVSNPDQPKVMWKIDNNTAHFSELGQTWSTPRVTKLKGAIVAQDGSTIAAGEPVLIFGAGYAGGFSATAPYNRLHEDLTSPNTSYTYSRGVFVVQASNGKLIKHIRESTPHSITRSVPSDVALVDLNNDGYTDTAYVGDLGGNVWRIGLEALNASGQNSAADWSLSKIAELGGKFFYPPDVVVTRNFRAVLIGSGNREDPRDSSSVDRFYMLKDTGGSTTLTMINLVDATSGSVPLSAQGWYLPLGAGEKVVNGALTVGGTTYFGTNQPDPANSSCTGHLGVARAYSISFLADKPPRTTRLASGGLPPSPVAGIVKVKDGDVEKLVPFLIGSGDKGSPIEATKIPVKVPPIRKRTYWYSRED